MSTVVLIPPAGTTTAYWQPQVAGLAARHRVRTPELPGRDGGRFTFAAAVDVVTAELDEPAYLVGLSLGATLAVAAALARPAAVRGLVLSGGMAYPPALLTVQRAAMAVLPGRALAALNARAVPADYRAQIRADHARIGRANLRAEMRELAAVDLRPRLAEVTAPTLVLCGTADRANLASARAFAAGIPGAELRLVDGVGHLWSRSHPGLFTDTVLDFLARGSPPPE